jgi:nitroimidazol reductase NimA-like FMN-containing flavoprotein (pyridoxamine 5'-phosphate oxidase superfamily)
MDDSPITEVPEAEAWELLRVTPLGRLTLSAGGEIDIFPVNYVAHDSALYFRTAPGTKLIELTVRSAVAFEIDGWTEHSAWSVVVKGTAERLELQAEIDKANTLPLAPWTPTLKYRWVRITPTQITARRFRRGPEPDRYPL